MHVEKNNIIYVVHSYMVKPRDSSYGYALSAKDSWLFMYLLLVGNRLSCAKNGKHMYVRECIITRRRDWTAGKF